MSTLTEGAASGTEGSTVSRGGPKKLKLLVFPDDVTVYQLPRTARIPPALLELPWFTISKTDDEISITVPSSVLLSNFLTPEDRQSVKTEGGWRVLKIEGVLDFGLVGILAQVVNALREAQVPVFVISTYNTDFVLVKGNNLEHAEAKLEKAGIVMTHSYKHLSEF